jgi:NADPH-dependent glutamate synthase beta subunit-like oxidoreductase
MAKPILLSVDDDSDVLRTIERDLRSQYGAEYRVIGSDSPEKEALDLLKQMRVRNDSVALLLADQRPKGWALERDPFLLETNVPGLFAVGDVRHGSVKRVASGVGEGSVAVQFIHQYLSKV